MEMESYCRSTLPEELIIEIFTRLPVKSLIRFKCINKTWRDSISSSNFATLHSHRNKNKPFSYISMSETRMQLFSDCKHTAYLHRPFMDKSNKYGRLSALIVGSSSNGLVCIRKMCGHLSFTIWNPATREFRYIPKSQDLYEYGFRNCLKIVGFDSRPCPCGDYRVVVILFCGRGEVRVELYSRSSNCWKKIKDGVVAPMNLADSKVVTLNGSMYWPICRIEGNSRVPYQNVACFNMWEEKYTRITGPYCGNKKRLSGRLGVVNGSSLAIFFDGEVGLTLDGWVMNGEDRSWTKQFSVITFNTVLELKSVGELVIVMLYRRIFSYHHSTKQLVFFPDFHDHLDVVQYKETLFSV